MIGLRAILFWGDHDKGDYYTEVAPVRAPGDWVRHFVPDAARTAVARYLDSGEQILGFMGYADCRICGDTLGSWDVGRDGLVWPQKASHYVLVHKVWTPEHEFIWKELSNG